MRTSPSAILANFVRHLLMSFAIGLLPLLLPLPNILVLSMPINNSISAISTEMLIEEGEANSTAKTLLPPEPTDLMPVSTAYLDEKTYSIKEFHELMMGLNQDIRNGFKKVEEERTHVAEVVSRLDNRMDRLEGLLDGKFMKGASSADGLLVVAGNNWPCLFLTAMALLLLAIALLVLCNTLLIRRLLLASTGIGTGTSGAAIENKREKKEVCGKQKGKERDQKEEKEQQQQRADTETMALVKKAEEGRI